MSQSVLFVCTGNYYRSRFAEYYLCFLADLNDWKISVFSKGLNIYNNNNIGPVSSHTKAYLKSLEIPLPIPIRFPKPLLENDFRQYERVIAMDREEHHPMILEQFPSMIDEVEFWKFPDTHLMAPNEMLPNLKEQIDRVFADHSGHF